MAAWSKDNDTVLSVHRDILALAIIFSCQRLVDAFSVSSTLGPLAIILGNIVLRDILAFIVLYVLTVSGFLLAFTAMVRCVCVCVCVWVWVWVWVWGLGLSVSGSGSV